MKEENYEDLFNLNPDDFNQTTEIKESEFFKPDPQKGKDKTYRALIRFIPFYKNPKGSLIKKYSYWLTDPLTGNSFSVDCPSTVNKKSILQDVYWKLRKSESVPEQKLSENFKRRENYYSLVQIIQDDQNPDLVGKIKIFKFGMKLHNIMLNEMNPEYGKGHLPFDPLHGRAMALKVTIVSGYNNYDLSQFVGDEMTPMIDGRHIENTQSDMENFYNFLKEKSPDLSKYDYQDWTDEIYSKVKSVIESTVPSMRTVDNMRKEATKGGMDISLDESKRKSSEYSKPKKERFSEEKRDDHEKKISMEELNLDDLENDDISSDDDFYKDLEL